METFPFPLAKNNTKIVDSFLCTLSKKPSKEICSLKCSRSLTKLLPSAFLTLTRLTPAEANEGQKRMKSRLNQDVLENMFDVIRLEVFTITLTERSSIKTDGGNVEVDNTPDMEGNYLSLTGNIFQRVSVDLKSAVPIEKIMT
ncbi:PREDICTED: uncharacterized protein LOC108977022 isoform X2 [Bactrocera latifrons]|uniref:uncharacterized protein LOC108977022 isoform X2 n=1 Tax=Bactrocera latifrons TaxID=174628 RepID=UPI0008DD59D1|nr:PREDICTED: uncharacterized protein LOC108977022 isoform X2 [Bactrocera latifrons]